MRFENKHFLIIIERKKNDSVCTEECKKSRKKHKWVPVAVTGAALVAVCGLVFFGPWKKSLPWNQSEKDVMLGNQIVAGEESSVKVDSSDINENALEEILPEGTYITSTRLANNIREKYKDQTPYGYSYGEPIKGLQRDENIEFSVGFNVRDLDITYWSEFIAIYQDPELTYQITPKWIYDEENCKMILSPTNYPIGNVATHGLNTEQVTKYKHSEYTLFPQDAGKNWGNIPTMYVAVYKDLETGADLQTPMVHIVTLEGEIKDAPALSFSIADDGRAHFSWEPVEGATDYAVCKIESRTEHGLDGNAYPMMMTDETSWTFDSPEFSSYGYTNNEFKRYNMSEEDWYDEYRAEYATENYGITEGVYFDQTYTQDEFVCVVAINENGTSVMSNLIALEDIASSLPYQVAYDTSKENGFNGKYETIEQFSAYGYVTMCDGYTATKLVDYKTDEAEIVQEHFIEIDEDGNYIQGIDLPVLKIPYVIEGTPFEYIAKIEEYDEVNLEKDLAFLDEREEKLRKKSGDISIVGEVDTEDAEILDDDLAELEVREVSDVEITANCALSEYIALNMLGGAKMIDLSKFPEADDPKFVDDAWREAYYQNPMILGVKGYRLNKNGTAMKVLYDEDAVTTASKQEEILAVIPEIIDSIITDDMSELEKELAINQYLCDTIVYDEDALANAEENDFLYVDDEFLDSFTAYGALIEGKCVCAGYAAAFKLLAEEAGLEAVVVTGILEGSLSHAWNKVRIDGEWQILDVTNNDNEYLFNALLNLPDSAGDRVLVEDKDYVIDMSLDNYESVRGDNEYYRINDRYFPYDEVTEQLVDELQKDGVTVLRTEYELNDDIFYQITDEIFEKMGDDIDLYGFYWMGVIYLSLSE